MYPQSKKIIGLTGGIATGKTTVSNYLSHRYQLPILDADVYAREAVKPNFQILKTIFARYGLSVSLPDGQLNRQALGDIIFNDSQERKWLESQIHPYVRKRFEQEINQLKSDIIVLAIPLLFEAKLTNIVTEIWVVYCAYNEQIRRLVERNKLTREQAISRINSQISLKEKVAQADVILDNSSTLEALYQQIDCYLF
ncbi:MAG TPA: dephospho-CoA kinase [Cyanothece sp. UBA12306]|nr:dephospho-CoA kinase [Cyanothece sp. UBA12306]